MNQNLIVLRALGRSGSYFLHNLLDSHAKLSILPITFKYYYHWKILHSIYKNPSRSQIINYFLSHSCIAGLFDPHKNWEIDYLHNPRDVKRVTLEQADFQKELEQRLSEAPSRKELLIAIHDTYSKLVGSTAKGDILLSETHGWETKEMHEDFPNLKIIATARDPRNSYASYVKYFAVKKPHSFIVHVNKCISEWVDVQVNTEIYEKNHPDQVYYIKTELLNAYPEQEVRALVNWIGIDFTNSLMSPTYAGFPIRGISVFKKYQEGFDINALQVDRTVEVCSPLEVKLVEKVFERSFEKHGYPYKKHSLISVLSSLFSPNYWYVRCQNETFGQRLTHLILFSSLRQRFTFLINIIRQGKKQYLRVPTLHKVFHFIKKRILHPVQI